MDYIRAEWNYSGFNASLDARAPIIILNTRRQL